MTVAGRVFVTGALGFIGRALSERYRAQGAEVLGMDVRAHPELNVVAGDISTPGDWQRDAAGCDLVVHTAATVSTRNEPAKVWRANALGTRHVVDAAVSGGAARFVQLSSVTVYSFEFPDQVTELHPPRPNGVPYVDTKVAGEQIVLGAHAAGELSCTVIRPGDVYGPGSRPWTILPVEELLRRRFILPAMGRGIFSPVYIDNVVDGIVLAAASDAAVGHVFNVSDGRGVECREFFGHYGRMTGRRVPVAPTALARLLASGAAAAAGARGRETEVNAASVDLLARTGTYSIDKARRVLGYEPAVDLAEGMRRTERWLRESGRLPGGH